MRWYGFLLSMIGFHIVSMRTRDESSMNNREGGGLMFVHIATRKTAGGNLGS